MKKILTLAIILLTLLPATEVSAQNYSSETSLWDLINKAWNNAMASDSDIYVMDFTGDFDKSEYSGYGSIDVESVNYNNSYINSNTSGNNGALPVGYALTTVDGKFLKDNIWYRTISYVPPSGATMCTTIPAYYPFYQTIDNECVLCASATIANIMGYNGGLCSNYKDYINTYRKIYDYTKDVLQIDLYEQMPDGNPEFYYNMIHNIGGVPVNMTNASDVKAYLDNGSAVLGVWSFPSNYVELNPSRSYHMVTIVGYDDSNYYCIDPGYISPQTYPISDFNQDFYYGYPILP